MIDTNTQARLDRWKLSLLDLSTANRLLDTKDTKTTLAIADLDALELVRALDDGAALGFEAGAPSSLSVDRRSGRLGVALPAAELARRLVAIRRTARAHLADGGVHTLWLGAGMLAWCDADGDPHVAPLALVPVALERTAGGGMRLVAADDRELRPNQTLAEKLRRDFEIVLPVTDELPALLEAAEGIAVTRPGWRVDRTARLGIFSFAKFTLWNDLDQRAGELLGSPIVAHLARGEGVVFRGPEIPTAIDVDVLAPLDADASQLAAVTAAGAGASFVLQGPPGTGKSQTIANLIVHCVSHGKTVLFVTEKMAALEVVQQRLAAVGLGELCLELHSHKAKRSEVLATLGRVLERAFRPASGPSGDDTRLAALRTALDGHVAALHASGLAISSLGRSLFDVLGRLVELRTTPRAALAERDAVALDRATFDRRKLAVEQLAAAALPVEPVATHPWRASTLERFPLDGRERALAALDELASSVDELAASVARCESLVPGVAARSTEQLAALGALSKVAAASPRPGAELLTQLRAGRGDDIGEKVAWIRAKGGGAIESPRDPASFLVLAYRHRMLRDEIDDRFTDAFVDLDAPALWTQLKKWSGRVAPLRFLGLRAVRAEIRAVAIPTQLETDGAMITALESVIAERACREALLGAAEPAARWFGELGGDPLALDLGKIDAAVNWAAELKRAFDAVEVAFGDAGRQSAWRALVAQVAAGPATSGGSSPRNAAESADFAAFARVAAAVERWQLALATVADTTGIALAILGAGADHIAAIREQIDTLRGAIDALRDWVQFHGARKEAIAAGVGPAVGAIERGDLGAAELAGAWERATLLAWADVELAGSPALARFHGAAHHANVAAFADLDRGSLALARGRAVVRFAERIPRTTGYGNAAAAEPGGELGALLHELKKQRGHKPLRALFAEIPTLLPKLAPCLLMSPLSVAQYLDPALPKFDLVVFDEASQLPTADAIGALARGDAAIVVGDSRQLPPTRFFQAAADDEDDEVVELESVLDDCVAARLPELRLDWHYRSRHEDLIAFANKRYYDDRLQVFPTAHGSPDLGISWRKIDGVYDRGGSRQNRAEAEAVVADIVARLRDPAQRGRSIGVVTFSRAQQELVEDLLDAARADDPALEPFFETPEDQEQSIEPVLVKNLETIQGDERDVVLLSVGYGPDRDGALTMNFGPLSQRGGERRLNVAITRARDQLVVFSSFTPEDIADDAPAAVRDLAALLEFARAGGGAARSAEDAAASPIAQAIARALVERGWIVRHQVGCGAYKVDLAIVDPNDPDRYVLAIEHDGPAYASGRVARDRDRLRAQVLAQLGWKLHRIWSLDWWADPDREIHRAHSAIVTALAASRQRRASHPQPARRASLAAGSSPIAKVPVPAIALGSGPSDAIDAPDTATAVRIKRGAIAIGPYTAAAIPAGRRAPDDMFAPRHHAELGKVIEQVLAAEAPMHLELLARRVGAYFGIGRVTQRVTDQVRAALAGRGKWGDEQGVVWRLDQDPGAVPAVRVTGTGAEARRDIDEVPLSELAAAARIVVERAVGIGTSELVRDAARLMGFARITERVTDRVARGIRIAAQREMICIEDGRATLPSE